MNQVNSEERYQPCAPVPYIHAPVYQEVSHNQCFGFFRGGPIEFLPKGMQNLLPMAITGTNTPQLLASTRQYYGDTLNCLQNYCVHPLPVGFSRGGPIEFLPQGTQNLPSVVMPSTQTLQPVPRLLESSGETLANPQRNNGQHSGAAGDLTACQLRNPSSGLPQGVAGVSAHTSHKPVEDALQKRELRLMKNREAARECRRKKKEYVKCLENRVAVLENQNKTLIEELRALKDIYRHKVE